MNAHKMPELQPYAPRPVFPHERARMELAATLRRQPGRFNRVRNSQLAESVSCTAPGAVALYFCFVGGIITLRAYTPNGDHTLQFPDVAEAIWWIKTTDAEWMH